MTEALKPKRSRGRPSEKSLPEPVPDTPESAMRVILATTPKKDDDSRYLREADD